MIGVQMTSNDSTVTVVVAHRTFALVAKGAVAAAHAIVRARLAHVPAAGPLAFGPVQVAQHTVAHFAFVLLRARG